jgi:2-keto-4-pentenoate hydratase/2-oxohepta-3-ene-1,7-dioic acid hydratase in catechol pathway
VGKARGRFLRDGDVVSATIDGIGSLTNPVAADS